MNAKFLYHSPQMQRMTISPLPPLAIGFMGLGTGYYVWGGHEFFGIPQASEKVNKVLGQ